METKIPTYRLVLGNRLKAARTNQGLSLRALGLMAGVDYSHLFDIEHGKANVTVDTLAKLADALDMRLKDFFD